MARFIVHTIIVRYSASKPNDSTDFDSIFFKWNETVSQS